MTPATPLRAEAGDDLHASLVELARGRREALAQVYDGTAEPALRLALARTRGDRVSAEQLLCRAYVEVRRRAAEYPASGMRALPWVLGVAARA